MTPTLSVTLAERVTVADSDVTSTDEGVNVNDVTSGASVSIGSSSTSVTFTVMSWVTELTPSFAVTVAVYVVLVS